MYYFENGIRIRTKYGLLFEVWVDYGNEFEGISNFNDLEVIDFLLNKVIGYPYRAMHQIHMPLSKFIILS
ncbi:hypothetical protein BH09BAC1_BH09BAC1_08860 [soil metagenome]